MTNPKTTCTLQKQKMQKSALVYMPAVIAWSDFMQQMLSLTQKIHLKRGCVKKALKLLAKCRANMLCPVTCFMSDTYGVTHYTLLITHIGCF